MYRILIFVTCIMLVLSIAGCTSNNVINNKEIYVPILADQAWLIADGTFLNGVNMAVYESNAEYANTGFSVKTAIVDDEDFYEKGVEMATQLSQDETVTAVFNLQNFDVSKTTASILSENNKIVVFPYGAYDSLFQKDNPYLFCSVAAFSDLGNKMAEYAMNNNYKKIAIYHNGKQSQEELVTAFELKLLNSETKVVDYVPSISSVGEFEGIYQRWKALGVDCVVIAQYGMDQAFSVLNMIRRKDKDIAIIGEPIFNSANVLADNKESAEGMAVPATMVIKDSEKLEAFKERYRKKYQKEADIWSVQGYDMLRLIVDTAVKLNTNNTAEISEALHQENGYEGISGHITFNKGGGISVDISKLPMLRCQNGMFQ